LGIRLGEQIELVRHLLEAKRRGHPYAVLLGSGMSRAAGVPLGEEMALAMIAHHCKENSLEAPEDVRARREWVMQQKFYERERKEWQHSEAEWPVDDDYVFYSACMSMPSDATRREYLQGCSDDARPLTTPYICLAQLMAHDYLRWVFTTNFDDLAAREIRRLHIRFDRADRTQNLPQGMASQEQAWVVHLHGIASSYSTCHLADEVAALPQELTAALRDILAHTGLIVIGYRGGDPDVMSALRAYLNERNPNFPVYWVAHESREDQLSAGARRLLDGSRDTFVIFDQDASEFLTTLCAPGALDVGTLQEMQDSARQSHLAPLEQWTAQTTGEQGDDRFKDAFIRAIQDKRKVRLTFFSKEDGTTLIRVCAPMDYGPSRRAHLKNDQYHLWDYESDTGPHTLPLEEEQVRAMVTLDEHFDPAEFVTWTTNWIIPRDWGPYS